MKQIKATPQGRWIDESNISSRSLDSAPMTPTRMPSPIGRRKKTFNWKGKSSSTKSTSTLSMLFSKLISPNGKKSVIEVSGQVKDLLDHLPSRGRAGNDSTIKSCESLAQKPSSTRSFGSFDSIPARPCRLPSPPEGEKDIIEVSGRSLEELLDTLPLSLDTIVAAHPPTKKTHIQRTKSEQSFDYTPLLPSRILSP